MARSKTDYSHVVDTATKMASRWTNKQQLAFTYFNENGAYKQHNALYRELLELVDAGKCRSGALIAHGADFHYGHMLEMWEAKSVGTIALKVLLQGWEREIAGITKFINEIK